MKKLTVILNSEQEEKVLLSLLNSLNYEYEVNHHSDLKIPAAYEDEREEEHDHTILTHYATE